MRPLLFTYITFFYFTSSILGQTNLGFENLQNNEFEAAVNAFQKDLDNKTMSAFANYGMATIYSNNDAPDYNIDKAWEYYQAYNEAYKNLNDKKQKKYKKEFKIRASKLKSKITEAAIAIADEKNTIEGYDDFLVFYKKTSVKYRNQVIEKRNQLAYDNAVELNTRKGFEEFLEKYKKSLKSKTPELWKAGQMRHFEVAMKAENWKMYDEFAKTFPTNPYVKSKGGKAYQAIHALKNKEKYQNFLDEFPKSLHQKFAKDQLVKILVQSGTEADFNWWLLSYPNHEANDELWKNFFFMYKGKYGQEGVLEFAKLYPNYPFPEDLEGELVSIRKNQEAQAITKIRHSKDALTLLNFLETYPDNENAPQLETQLLSVIQNNPTILTYEKFLTLYPKSNINNNIIADLYDMYSINLDEGKIREFKLRYGGQFADAQKIEDDLLKAKEYETLQIRDFDKNSKNEFDQFIKNTAPHPAAYKILTRIIEDDINRKNWEQVRITTKKYEPYFKDGSIPYNQLLSILEAPAQNVRLNKLSSAINTSGSEYAPVISADGNVIYFCGRDRDDNLGNEDIFISTRSNERWAPAGLMIDVNTIKSSEAPEAISVDGTQMLLFRSGKLCFSNRTATGWSDIEYLPEVINATKWQGDASISSNGKVMLFASQREDRVGFANEDNYDIYVCLKDENGKWNQVLNIGNRINTPFRDRSPFLHPDMKTLYFSSDGHGGLGKLDVYKTTRLDDSWTNWSTPVNLGREINTPNHDWGYKVSTDGTTAFFSFSPDNSMSEDIYKVDLPKAMRPQAVSTISGVLKNSQGAPVDAEIVIEDLESGKVVAQLKSNPQTGEFFAVLPDNRKYSYHIQKENYFPIANNIDLSQNQQVEIKENLEMFTVAELTEKGINITLENIFFDTDKYELKPESFSELNRVLNLIQANNFKVELFGYTDSDGNPNYNNTLSKNRADAVRSYLIKKGADASKISAIGLGESNPIASNKTENGKSKNRRVEVKFSY